MDSEATITLRDQTLRLLPQKALIWEEERALLLADLHMGKSGHFRKYGIPVPGTVNRTNLDILGSIVESRGPEKLIVLGDLFHSRENREWQQFEEWRNRYAGLELYLVIGNHDILPARFYHSSRIHLFHKLRIGPFLLLHNLDSGSSDPENDTGSQGPYLLSGHVHPAVKLRGKGRQSMKLPCFYFGRRKGILPAFGQFTGTHVIDPRPGDRVFAVAEQQLVAIDTENGG
ncbi:MAG: ligase-associated DNA damage response endonuclease PdeM [Balneolaceae bacterium]|nr:ligase-associated DNA damage response endonuclease PdeM [Balneolaceae bacterium]